MTNTEKEKEAMKFKKATKTVRKRRMCI